MGGCRRLEVRCPEEMEQASTEELSKLTHQAPRSGPQGGEKLVNVKISRTGRTGMRKREGLEQGRGEGERNTIQNRRYGSL